MYGAVVVRSGYSNHSWCEVKIDGTWYVFDPEGEQAMAGRDFYQFQYGRSGTLKYVNIKVLPV